MLQKHSTLRMYMKDGMNNLTKTGSLVGDKRYTRGFFVASQTIAAYR